MESTGAAEPTAPEADRCLPVRLPGLVVGLAAYRLPGRVDGWLEAVASPPSAGKKAIRGRK